MLYRVVQSCYVFLLVCCLFVPVIRTSAMNNRVPHALADFPTVDPGASLTYTWDFGDGTQASGITVDHTYAIKGNSTLTLTVRSATALRQVQKIIPVLTQPVVYNNPYKGDEGDGDPPSNPQVVLPRPNETLSDKVLSSPNLMGSTSWVSVPPVTSGQSAGTRTLFGPIIISIGVLIVALMGIWFVVMRRQRNAKL